MSLCLVILGLLIASVNNAEAAEEYAYCLIGEASSTVCEFRSLVECRATARGLHGQCDRNYLYSSEMSTPVIARRLRQLQTHDPD